MKRRTHQSNLTANESQWNFWLGSLGCKLIRVVWIIHFWLLNKMHFVWLNAFAILVHNPVIVFWINWNIILYQVLFIKYLWIYKIFLVSIEWKSTEKKLYISFKFRFFILLIAKSFETLPKRSPQSSIFEFFPFNWYNFVALTNKELLFSL